MLQYYLAVISLTYPPPLLDTPHNVSPDALPLDSPWDALQDALLDVLLDVLLDSLPDILPYTSPFKLILSSDMLYLT